MAYNKKLGERVKLTREKFNISVDELADRSGINAETIKKIEQGDLAPYLNPLIKIARALGVRLGTFLDDKEQIGPVITKKEDMDRVERFRGIDSENERNRTFFSLALNKTSRHMEPFIVELSPADGESRKLSSHEGEEFIYVLEAQIEVIYGKDSFTLNTGESIYYDSIVEHDILAAGNNPAKIIAVVHEPA